MSRIYLTTDKTNGKQQLVRGNNQAQALHRLVQDRFSVEVASQDQLLAIVKAGGAVLGDDESAPGGGAPPAGGQQQ